MRQIKEARLSMLIDKAMQIVGSPRPTMLASAGQVLAIRVLGAGLAYGSMVLLARWLGSFEFGIFAYVSVIVTLLGILFSFGFASSAVRLISDYFARRRLRRLAGFLIQSHQFVFLSSIAGALVAGCVIYAARSLLAAYYVTPLLLGLLCVPAWALLTQFETTARAFGWIRLAYVPGYILRPVLVTAGVGMGVFFGGGADAVTAVWSLIAACVVAVAIQGTCVRAAARRRLAGVSPAFHSGAWTSISLGFFTIDGLRMLLDNADMLIAGQLLDPGTVAIYYAVIRTGNLLAFISFSVLAFAAPKFAELHAGSTREDLQAFVSTTIRLMVWPTLVAGAALALAGPMVLSLFGPNFGTGYPVLLVVIAGLMLRSASAPVEHLLNMTGHHRDTIKVYSVAAIVSVALNLLLISKWGILGAAVASYTAILGANAGLYLLVQKRLGISAFVIAPKAKRGRLMQPAGTAA